MRFADNGHDVPRPERGLTNGVDKRIRSTFYVGSALVVAFLVSLIVRHTGSYFTPIDGWGVDLFELSMGALCIHRYFDISWRSAESPTSLFPLVLGAACIAWGLGDFALTIESLGGATAPVPSGADGCYIAFFPRGYIGFMMLIRRGNTGSLGATSLDGLIAGLAAASLSAAFVFNAVLRATGAGHLSTATSMAFPVGDVLLLALAVGALAVLPRDYRRFFGIASIAMTVNLI